jgi:endoglucanase
VTDTVPAGGTPDVIDRRLPIFIGKGPVLSYADQSGTGAFKTLNNRRLLRAAEEGAKKLGIPLQKTAMYGLGGYVTNTSGIYRLGSHCPAFAIATPRRYSHSPIELLNLNDAVYAYELISYFAKNNGNFNCDFL